MLIPGIWGRPVRGGMPLSGKALGTGLVIRALPQAVDQTDNRERLRHHSDSGRDALGIPDTPLQEDMKKQ